MDKKIQRKEMGLGGVEHCYCSKCDYKEEHPKGIPCAQKKCPKCGSRMMGEICKD